MELVRYAFVALLVVVLAAAVVAFVVMGLGKVRRTRRLAGAAHQSGRRFFADDPFGLARRFADFTVLAGGHSGRASNVTDGRLMGRSVRAFDFRCESGHGTRRTPRLYSVVAADVPEAPADVLMWPDEAGDLPPLATWGRDGRLGPWSYRGDAGMAAALAGAWPGPADDGPCIEVRGPVLFVAAPAKRSDRNYAVSFEQAEALMAATESALS